MIQILKKTEQYNTIIFNGRFIANKPVASGTYPNVQPYSNLFYWSHSITIDDCEFDLHPHKGFEIMTFILEGSVNHYDTATKVWTQLEAGDFQVMQSNSGLQHREKISKGSRCFQIWFDPNYFEAIKEKPAYTDYHSKGFMPINENGIKTITYVGGSSKSFVKTPQIMIKRVFLENNSKQRLQLDKNSSYTFYVLKGNGLLAGSKLSENDAIRISDEESLEMEFTNTGEIFFIQTPLKPEYKVVWE